jgi:RNA polymerase sigma-B factor
MTTYSQNYDLFLQYQADRDRKLRDKIFKINENLIHSVIKKMTKFGWEYDDLYQCGAIGLVFAIDRFDPSNGAAFSSYAVPYIRGEMLRYFRDRFGLVKPPRPLYELYCRGQKFIEKHQQAKGRTPSEVTIACGLDVDLAEWRDAVFANTKPDSLDVAIPDSLRTRIDYVPSPEKEDIPTIEIEELLNSIDPKFSMIIREIYWKNRTAKSIAKDFGVWPMTITRWKQSALRKLRVAIGNHPIN